MAENSVRKYNSDRAPKSGRIDRLVKNLFLKMPEIESARALLLTESYKATEGEPIVMRRAKAFAHILKNIPIIIRDEELIVGSSTLAPRGCQTYPEFSYEWLEAEFDTVATREADPFFISDKTKKELKEADAYWKGKTTSELASSYMAPETKKAIDHFMFTPGNYYYNGVGHYTCKYWELLEIGFEGIKEKALKELETVNFGDANYAEKNTLLRAMVISCDAVILYAARYRELALGMAKKCQDSTRKSELLKIAENLERVPAKGASTFYEACQRFWFVQQLLQLESSGHSISPGRFDQYMYPYFEKDMEEGRITRDFAQELIDCIWVKLNDLNKCRDAESAKGFAGYSLFQNLIVGGQDENGLDVTNDLSFMCLDASMHVFLPMPSLSIRVWNGSPYELLMRAAEVTRTGIGLPAYYNDEVIIPSLMSMGLPLEEARDYGIIGCVEPQKGGKTLGWHDAAFYNMCRPLELVFSNGMDAGEQIGLRTGEVEDFKTFDEFYDAYKKQQNYFISLLVNADNSIDKAHAELVPLPFLASLMDDCMKRGKTPEQGGCVYNFTGPQGFGIANMADSLYAVKTLVFDEKKVTLGEFKKALMFNYGKGFAAPVIREFAGRITAEFISHGVVPDPKEVSKLTKKVLEESVTEEDKKIFDELLKLINNVPKFGNDIDEVDLFARDVAYTYTRPLLNYKNPRG
ncbi:MAG: pyruvate formate lyase family protein, partial [Lachnospiraceae bacterium]|nr:pyruvate formate lyase family protein [Lachnospiraceae bacterium]